MPSPGTPHGAPATATRTRDTHLATATSSHGPPSTRGPPAPSGRPTRKPRPGWTLVLVVVTVLAGLAAIQLPSPPETATLTIYVTDAPAGVEHVHLTWEAVHACSTPLSLLADEHTISGLRGPEQAQPLARGPLNDASCTHASLHVKAAQAYAYGSWWNMPVDVAQATIPLGRSGSAHRAVILDIDLDAGVELTGQGPRFRLVVSQAWTSDARDASSLATPDQFADRFQAMALGGGSEAGTPGHTPTPQGSDGSSDPQARPSPSHGPKQGAGGGGGTGPQPTPPAPGVPGTPTGHALPRLGGNVDTFRASVDGADAVVSLTNPSLWREVPLWTCNYSEQTVGDPCTYNHPAYPTPAWVGSPVYIDPGIYGHDATYYLRADASLAPRTGGFAAAWPATDPVLEIVDRSTVGALDVLARVKLGGAGGTQTVSVPFEVEQSCLCQLRVTYFDPSRFTSSTGDDPLKLTRAAILVQQRTTTATETHYVAGWGQVRHIEDKIPGFMGHQVWKFESDRYDAKNPPEIYFEVATGELNAPASHVVLHFVDYTDQRVVAQMQLTGLASPGRHRLADDLYPQLEDGHIYGWSVSRESLPLALAADDFERALSPDGVIEPWPGGLTNADTAGLAIADDAGTAEGAQDSGHVNHADWNGSDTVHVLGMRVILIHRDFETTRGYIDLSLGDDHVRPGGDWVGPVWLQVTGYQAFSGPQVAGQLWDKVLDQAVAESRVELGGIGSTLGTTERPLALRAEASQYEFRALSGGHMVSGARLAIDQQATQRFGGVISVQNPWVSPCTSWDYQILPKGGQGLDAIESLKVVARTPSEEAVAVHYVPTGALPIENRAFELANTQTMHWDVVSEVRQSQTVTVEVELQGSCDGRVSTQHVRIVLAPAPDAA